MKFSELQESEDLAREEEFKTKDISVSFCSTFYCMVSRIYYIGGKHQEQRLYKHGFRLLEEQIDVYIKENHSGISKVEFTDIYIHLWRFWTLCLSHYHR